MNVIEKEVFTCQLRKKTGRSRFRAVPTKEIQGRNLNTLRSQSNNIINLLVHVPRNTGLPQKIQTKHTGTIN